MAPDKDREALINDALAQLRKKLEQELPGDNATLDDIEEAVGKIGDALQNELQQKLLQRRSRKPRPNQSACPTCGRAASYKGKAERRLVSAYGLVRLRRPYYYCAFCKRGHAPLDAELGLDRGSTTRKVRRWAAELAAKEPFEEATQTLFHLTGVSLSAATLERIAIGVGDGLAKAQQSQVQQYQQQRLPEPKGRRPQRLYIGMDGLMVPLREPWKKDASQGDLSCRFGECKTGVVYEAHAGKQGDERVRTHAYCATLADVHQFAPLLATLAQNSGYGFARERVVLGDGAPWIWQLAGKHFPQALQIVDFYHACAHLASVADARFGVGTEASRAWQKVRQEELRADGVRAVLGAIAGWKPKTQEMRRLRRREFGYFRSNIERMRYGTFLSKGYHIGSGVVEAACKHVVALRLDQAGMHWRQETAEAIVRVRAALRSTYPPDLSPYCAMPA
jgi:uncharacterized protein UPF0236